jgi:hypothetical protein
MGGFRFCKDALTMGGWEAKDPKTVRTSRASWSSSELRSSAYALLWKSMKTSAADLGQWRVGCTTGSVWARS